MTKNASKLSILLAILILLTGCAGAPYVCQSTDADTCILETKLNAVYRSQRSAAFWAMHNSLSTPTTPALPVTHRQHMCAAGAVTFC